MKILVEMELKLSDVFDAMVDDLGREGSACVYRDLQASMLGLGVLVGNKMLRRALFIL